eukprot:GHVS01032548.1.p1 GENE.GHVS01032548.1~~GHVS01032548.1.p1  ORF type:complete len:102 (+),score=1.11 GHVS01032548.1:220-525(+)
MYLFCMCSLFFLAHSFTQVLLNVIPMVCALTLCTCSVLLCQVCFLFADVLCVCTAHTASEQHLGSVPILCALREQKVGDCGGQTIRIVGAHPATFIRISPP